MTDSQHSQNQSHLADVVTDMLEADEKLHEDAKLLVLAALDGNDELAVALEDEYTAPTAQRPAQTAALAEPVGAFIRSIEARGFRGIGPRSRLDLQPAPGLTVVAGRNGSGKSSFSEALELAITGSTYRWNRKNTKQAAVWSHHWRNLHDGRPCEIRIELAEEGAGTTTVGVDWSDAAALADRTTWVQRRGKPRERGVGGLGWDRAVELYQPILSYDELGGLLESDPSKLFDKLDAILGIDEATDTERRLAEAAKEVEQPEAAVKLEVRELKKVLASLDDPRAEAARELLRKHDPDLDALEGIATGTSTESSPEIGTLRTLSRLGLPARQAITDAAQALRTGAERLAQASVGSVDLLVRRTGMLREALQFHAHSGDGPCPVCGQGTLDSTWRERVERELAVEDESLKRHREARHQLSQARDQAHALIRTVRQPTEPGQLALEALAEARDAWRRWSQVPEHDLALADHLESAYDDLEATFTLLRDEATETLAAFEDAWTPHATRLAAWVALARKAREKEPVVQRVRAAREFMKAAVETLRNRELERLTGTAHEVWAALKQESNVDLGKIELKGGSTRRRVELRADVDGAEAQALGVMSQGELHALALALFLPRATMPGSPFRFVVLDDPIQAMDPAKVDGFVRILVKLAEDRQVVVFSHDDRLPQAIRQLGVDARILEVSRDANSAVHVLASLDPAGRYLDDALAVAKDPAVKPDVKARVLPALCRMAVESAARDRFMARRLIAGDARTEVEDAWQHATKTTQRMALALHGDKQADLTAWRDAKSWRRAGHRIVTKAAHNGIRTAPVDAVRDVQRLVRDLRDGAR